MPVSPITPTGVLAVTGWSGERDRMVVSFLR